MVKSLLALSVCVFACLSLVSAAEQVCANVVVTDISPSSIKVGDEFTIGLSVENCGDYISQDVVFEIRDVSPDLGFKESLVREIGGLEYANSKRFILYHVKVGEDALPGPYSINYVLKYKSGDVQFEKEGNFSVTVIGDKAEIGIASVKTAPVLPMDGDTVELVLRVENSGEGEAKSVRVYANHPYRGIKQSFIGTLDANEDGPAIFTFIANKQGESEFPVTITYIDDFGEHEIVTNVSVNVLESDSNIWGIILVLIVVIVVGVLVYYIWKVKRSKDNVIQQLLRGTHANKK